MPCDQHQASKATFEPTGQLLNNVGVGNFVIRGNVPRGNFSTWSSGQPQGHLPVRYCVSRGVYLGGSGADWTFMLDAWCTVPSLRRARY